MSRCEVDRRPLDRQAVARISANHRVEHMQIASGAMRQGILWDMVGRRRHRDIREATVRQFMKRYHVDTSHAHRVERLAKKFHEQLSAGDDPHSGSQLLSWAAP